MNVIDLFKNDFFDYKIQKERMGNSIQFVYNVENENVGVYIEEWDCYDGYDNSEPPYYYALYNNWNNISLLEFAKLMEFYLNYKEQFDHEKIYCYFNIVE